MLDSDFCGAKDEVTGSVCNKRRPHEVHSMTDESFVITWTAPRKIILIGEDEEDAEATGFCWPLAELGY